jgi:hypothetical protein
MIPVACPRCFSKFNAPDNAAGRTAKCPNCSSPIVVPSAAPPPPTPVQPATQIQPATAAVGTPSSPGGTTVVVQVQAPAAAGTIGPAPKSAIVVLLLWLIPIAGVHYIYLGQTGKFAVALLIDLFIFDPIIFFTCGLGLILWFPWHILLLIDGLVVSRRIRSHAISPWRCF